MESSSPGDKRRRAQRACQFCHQRKMKCNNELPKCSNCLTHGQACTYAQGPKKPRPSNDRISHLEEENRRLQASLAIGSTTDDQEAQRSVRMTRNSLRNGPVEGSTRQATQPSHTDDESIAKEDRSLSPVRADAPKTTEFHGPSSVLFDVDAPNVGQTKSGEHPLEPLSAELMAQAATQRQLESIHFSTLQLDTDGVEPKFAEDLLSLFWKTANSAFLVVYRPAFMRDWACGGPHYSKLLLNAIYHNASRHASEDSIHQNGPNDPILGARFLHRFKELLRENFEHSTITTVQALLVMSASLSALGNGRRVAWLYSGMAFRMIIDLGLHTCKPCPSMSKQLSDEDMEIQRRLFWGAFSEMICTNFSFGRPTANGRTVIDKLQSFYYGRPASIQEADISVPFTLRDHHDELEQWAPMEPARLIIGSYSPSYCVSNFSRLCRLSLIMNKVLNEIYREKTKFENPDMLIGSLTRLNHDLDELHNTLPLHLRFSPASIGSDTAVVPAPHTYTATIMYYVLQILLHRPFVSEGHLQAALPTVALDSFSSCVAAADSIAQYLDSFNRAHTFKKAPYFLFYASYVSATIHVRIAAQKQLETNAYAYLRTCFLVFDVNGEDNAAAAKAKAVIQQLMNRMGVSLPSQAPLQSNFPPAQQDPTPQAEIAVQKSDRQSSLHVSQALDDKFGASQLQEWEFGDLDFDAVLQSFDQPSKANGADRQSQSATTTGLHQPEESLNNPLDTPGEIYNMPDTMDNIFDQGFSNDVLFGFDIPEPGDSN